MDEFKPVDPHNPKGLDESQRVGTDYSTTIASPSEGAPYSPGTDPVAYENAQSGNAPVSHPGEDEALQFEEDAGGGKPADSTLTY